MVNVSEIAAVVVLYNSPMSRMSIIDTYRTQVSKLYVIDNSDTGESALADHLSNLPDVVYMSSGTNEGIASALNQATQAAIADGFCYLLTMDDDTSVPANLIDSMISFLNSYEHAGQVGILAASHNKPTGEIDTSNLKHGNVLVTMTSGNLLNLAIYAEIGPYRSDFFIDHVDHDYCLRMHKAKFEIIELPNLVLTHQLGERIQASWTNFQYVSHAPIRGYYFVRNGLVLVEKYRNDFPGFCRKISVLIAKEFIKALLFETDKKVRLNFLWKGVSDKKSGRLGKLLL